MRLELGMCPSDSRASWPWTTSAFGARGEEITGYLGPNGSGKSTTMKMITGLIETTDGEIFSRANRSSSDLDRLQAAHGLRARGAAPLRHLSGLEYLVMVGQLRDLPPTPTRRTIEACCACSPFTATATSPISSYSKGMRQKVLLSAALLHNPDLILLDEPFSGLDVGTALVLRSLIQELAARGKVVLFSSHELETVERVCSHVVILHRGKVVADDSIEHLRP